MMLAQLDMFASGESCRRARTLKEARELVASFNADRDAGIDALYEAEYGARGACDPALTVLISDHNARLRKRTSSTKYNQGYDHFDHTTRGSSAGSKKVESRGFISRPMKTQTETYRLMAEREFDKRMESDTAWSERSALADEMFSALQEWDVPFGDDPPAGVFGYVDDVIGDVHVPMRALRVGKAKPTVPLESFRYQGASRAFDDDMRRRAPAQSTNSPSVGGMMIRSDIMATTKACACVECHKTIPAGEIIELVTEPCEAGPFCSWKCRTAGVDRAMRRPTALLEAVHGCEECGSVTPRLLLDHGRKLCTACWTLSVD